MTTEKFDRKLFRGHQVIRGMETTVFVDHELRIGNPQRKHRSGRNDGQILTKKKVGDSTKSE